MDVLKNDSRKIELTPQFIEKSDKDIATIAALDKLATETGNILVLSGGYATEAYCEGKITRAHGDVDAHIILTGNLSPEEVFAKVRELLDGEDTPWTMREQKSDKLDYLEDSSDKDFFEKRRIEIRLNIPNEVNTKYPKRKLITSDGKEIEVCIADLEQIVLEKIHKFYELKNGVDTTTDRHSSKSDIFDLKRLLELKELNQEKIREKVKEEYDYAVSLKVE